MNTENMQIGLSNELRTNTRQAVVSECLTKLLVEGNPGDENDPEILMANVSALMNGAPVSALFEGEDVDVALFVQPQHDAALAISFEELGTPPYQAALAQFGFNPATLLPVTK
jgi:hypothetical protein